MTINHTTPDHDLFQPSQYAVQQLFVTHHPTQVRTVLCKVNHKNIVNLNSKNVLSHF